jgi:O-antigen/teichoic acid export membrane protein
MLTPVLGLRSATPGRRLFSQTAGNLGLNGGAVALNLAIALLLSHLLGSQGYGAYAFALSWAMLLTVPALLGLPSVVVREMTTYRVHGDWSRARGLVQWANRAVLAASLAISITLALIFWALAWPRPFLMEPTLLGLALVPLVTVISLRQYSMRGFGAVVLGRTPEALVAPTLVIVFVVVLAVSLPHGLSRNWAMGAQLLAAAFTALVGIYLLRRTLPEDLIWAEPRNEPRAWLAAGLPLLLLGVITAVNSEAGTILTGSIAGSHDAGIYNIAVRIAGFLPFLLFATVPALMPTVAEFHARGEREPLQRVLTKAARTVFFVSLPIALGVIVFAGPLLDLFGNDFGAGVATLRILCIGQIVNLATGFAGTTLIMTGEAGQLTRALALGAGVNLMLCAALIPGLGAEGAAVATATSVTFINILTAYLLWRRRRIYSAPFGLRIN